MVTFFNDSRMKDQPFRLTLMVKCLYDEPRRSECLKRLAQSQPLLQKVRMSLKSFEVTDQCVAI